MQPSETRTAADRLDIREVPLGESVDLDRLIQAVSIYGGGPDDDRLTLVDFRRSSTFDVIALLFLLGMVKARLKDDRLTRFRLPQSRAALSALRGAGFLDAASHVTRAPLPLLLAREDVQRLAKPPETLNWGTGTATEQILQDLQHKRVLGLSLHPLGNETDKNRMVENELERWTDPLALALFSQHLKEAAEWDVARVVVHEILANVQEHPQASVAVVAAQMSLPTGRRESADGGLTVAVWDDGKSIVETLRECMVSRGDVRVSPPPDRFTVRVVRSSSIPGPPGHPPLLPSDWSPSLDGDDAELLLASLFPGISRKDPRGRAPDTDRSDIFLGCGLYFLYRHVIDVFRGSLDLYSGSTRLTISAESDPESGAQYLVTVHGGPRVPRISGNLVVARLPTHAG
ncbi:hypothetical protein NIE79_005230 [Micromonospora sp. NIE79]|uniref:STAS domain-containing protein n=1 Tax=Micromonospora trifolii TaxID=2911208 RepID=A0ABS9N9A0_9ACTN|nr:hypothetical protein [Micromonospora trifolii]MCG5446531.1 hypothetical protein [Micromonospora trifolii]